MADKRLVPVDAKSALYRAARAYTALWLQAANDWENGPLANMVAAVEALDAAAIDYAMAIGSLGDRGLREEN